VPGASRSDRHVIGAEEWDWAVRCCGQSEMMQIRQVTWTQRSELLTRTSVGSVDTSNNMMHAARVKYQFLEFPTLTGIRSSSPSHSKRKVGSYCQCCDNPEGGRAVSSANRIIKIQWTCEIFKL
jgi:hypothetical protein